MDDIKKLFDLVFNNYKNIESLNRNTLLNIRKVENVYQIYINSEQIDSVNYSIYIDDIKHQVDITLIEYKYICDINNVNIIKFYRDLFKMYNRIVKVILNIYLDNKIMVMKIWKTNTIFPNENEKFNKIKNIIKTIAERNNDVNEEKQIFDSIKKYYYSTIKIYNEIDENEKIDFNCISILFNETYKRMEELMLTSELVNINLIDIKEKTKKGVIGQAYTMDLISKINKIKTEHYSLIKLMESIFNIHHKLSDKYHVLSQQILDDITYDDKTNNNYSPSLSLSDDIQTTPSSIISLTPSKKIMESINKLSDLNKIQQNDEL
jgi:hypothetical protein